MFIGREEELKIIKEKLESSRFELGVIYGQRRIGKTSIILEAVKGYRYLYLLARDDGYENNLRYFSDEYKKIVSLPFTPVFRSFDEFFDSLIEYAKDEKFIIIIDELPFLAKAYPGIVSYLQKVSDLLKREERDIKVILSGSDMSFMVDLLENKAKPLYQRSTFKVHVRPMQFSDAVKMLDGVNDVDIAKYLSIFGNRPYYLDKIHKSASFEDNIKSLCFSNGSILLDAPNITLPIGYTANSTFISIIVSLSNHKNKIKEMAESTGLGPNALATYLGRMLEGGSIEKKNIFNGNQKTTYYEISDPFIRFYYRVIYPNLQEIDRGIGFPIYHASLNLIEDVIDHGFEDVVISYLNELNASSKLPKVFHQFKRYAVDNSKLGRSIEIDALGESLDGQTLLVAEAKFKNKNLSLDVLNHLKESASIFANDYKEVYYYLFSKSSFSDDLLGFGDGNVKLISLADMLK